MYISSVRYREIVVLEIGSRVRVRLRIKTKGSPNQMILDRQQKFLYVAQDNSDSVTVIDTRLNEVVEDVATAGAAWLELWTGQKEPERRKVTFGMRLCERV